MVFQCFNIRQVPREGLKTAASSLDFQYLPRDLANVNAWKPMFDPYITAQKIASENGILQKDKVSSRKHVYVILIPSNPTFI